MKLLILIMHEIYVEGHPFPVIISESPKPKKTKKKVKKKLKRDNRSIL
ncbi:MAG: hypothetical protein K0S44_2277 [Bacteroidetes bacterium]|jgi:hypothetical protein|nr:hypothetical protein [Bacteroidota bacterium]